MNSRLFKIYILADLIETEINELDPINKVEDITFASKLYNLKRDCTKLRSYMDDKVPNSAESFGDFCDYVNELIDEKIQEINAS